MIKKLAENWYVVPGGALLVYLAWQFCTVIIETLEAI